MKYSITLFIFLFVCQFDLFGQLKISVQKQDTVRTHSPFDSYAQGDSCITTQKKNNKLRFECFDKETHIIQARITRKTNSSRKWNKKTRTLIWDDNGKKRSRSFVREKYGYFDSLDIVPGRNSNVSEITTITWYFRRHGKLCLKRKKETNSVRYHS